MEYLKIKFIETKVKGANLYGSLEDKSLYVIDNDYMIKEFKLLFKDENATKLTIDNNLFLKDLQTLMSKIVTFLLNAPTYSLTGKEMITVVPHAKNFYEVMSKLLMQLDVNSGNDYKNYEKLNNFYQILIKKLNNIVSVSDPKQFTGLAYEAKPSTYWELLKKFDNRYNQSLQYKKLTI